METYCSRAQFISEFLKKKSIRKTSENFLKISLDNNDIQIEEIDFTFNSVRGDSSPSAEKFQKEKKLIKQYNLDAISDKRGKGGRAISNSLVPLTMTLVSGYFLLNNKKTFSSCKATSMYFILGAGIAGITGEAIAYFGHKNRTEDIADKYLLKKLSPEERLYHIKDERLRLQANFLKFKFEFNTFEIYSKLKFKVVK